MILRAAVRHAIFGELSDAELILVHVAFENGTALRADGRPDLGEAITDLARDLVAEEMRLREVSVPALMRAGVELLGARIVRFLPEQGGE